MSAAYDTAWQTKIDRPSGASRPGTGNGAAENVSSQGRTAPVNGFGCLKNTNRKRLPVTASEKQISGTALIRSGRAAGA